jgi:hypothetical protein
VQPLAHAFHDSVHRFAHGAPGASIAGPSDVAAPGVVFASAETGALGAGGGAAGAVPPLVGAVVSS